MNSRTLFLLATIVATLLPAPSFAATPTAGDLIKGPGDAVYYYGQSAKRYVFPTAKTYFTWYADFSGVKTLTTDELGAIPIGGNVTYRPGVKLVKITTDPKVYAVAKGGTLRWVATEAIAKDLYGADWAKKVEDIPDAFFINYTVGASILSSTDYAPTTETSLATTINADKALGTNGPPTVTLTTDKSSATAGMIVTLTATAAFQGSGSFQNGVVKVNGQVLKTCIALPCIAQSQALADGTTNNFTAEITDTNGLTGKSATVTILVPYSRSY